MNILIYGAGVLGSYLAYELSEAGHEISMLARGKRYETLKTQGLVIEHYLQKKTTVSQVKVVDSFTKTDEYDAVFVVMQRKQVADVLPILAANEKCQLYILVGNNGDAETTYTDLMKMSHTKPTILFGFQGSGGRNENGRIISVHSKQVDFAIGDMTKKADYKGVIETIFAGTHIKPWHCDNIDSWLKYHLALILPMAYAVHYAHGDMRKLSKSGRILHQTIQAIREGIALLEQLGYPPEPVSLVAKLNWPTWIWYLILKFGVKTKVAKLVIRDHAMAAIGEMNLLTAEFQEIVRKSAMKTPAYDELAAYLLKG